MNNVIQDLAKYAAQLKEDMVNNPDAPSYDEIFAELIIAECVDIADDYVKDFLVEEHIKCNHPRSKIGLKIKQHFGVGE